MIVMLFYEHNFIIILYNLFTVKKKILISIPAWDGEKTVKIVGKEDMILREVGWGKWLNCFISNIYPCPDVDCDVLQAVGGIYEDMGDMNAGVPKVSKRICIKSNLVISFTPLLSYFT